MYVCMYVCMYALLAQEEQKPHGPLGNGFCVHSPHSHSAPQRCAASPCRKEKEQKKKKKKKNHEPLGA